MDAGGRMDNICVRVPSVLPSANEHLPRFRPTFSFSSFGDEFYSIKMKMSPLPVASSSDSRISGFGDRELVALLTKYFGYSTFRGQQLEAINAVLLGRDCFCLMPTGAGKSLCFQIPALAKSGIVLVICPLIALMENQVASLKEKEIPAEYIASTQPDQIKGKIYDDLESGRPIIRLLYVTPELVTTTRFMSKLRKLNSRGLLTLIAIDEAHCISTWGHDFRPSYRKLSHLREQLKGVPLLALTATAVPKVQNDVITLLSLHDPLILRASFNRPNIFYEVRYKDVLNDTFADLLKLLQSYKGACCIVYCLERSTCDELAAHLSRGGISCAAYHAGLNNKLRSSVLDKWILSKIHVVVATVAFGMGIDRKDVRVVCHFNIPKSMEAFYQESGRAGRDQQPSRSVLYYGVEDRRKIEFILNNAVRKKLHSPIDHDGLSKKPLETFTQMVEYCEGHGCRRKKILESFGEQVSALFCGKTCDACKHPVLVTENLGKLVQAPGFCRSNGLCPIFINSSINVESRDEEVDLCDDDNQTNLSEDISDSDDGLEVICSLHKSGMTSKSGIMDKLECLQRAEESHYQKDPKNKPRNSDNNKKAVTEAQRQACKVRLLDALKQTEQRLGDLRVNLEASAAALEGECFVKFGKAGKSFYISQVASSVRWLMSTNYADFCKRLGFVSTEETHISEFKVAVSSSEKLDLQPVEKPTHGSTKETAQVATSFQPVFVNSEIPYEQKVLPHIMSISEFVSKRSESELNCSPSSKKHLSANIIRKNGDKEEKKMRLC